MDKRGKMDAEYCPSLGPYRRRVIKSLTSTTLRVIPSQGNQSLPGIRTGQFVDLSTTVDECMVERVATYLMGLLSFNEMSDITAEGGKFSSLESQIMPRCTEPTLSKLAVGYWEENDQGYIPLVCPSELILHLAR